MFRVFGVLAILGLIAALGSGCVFGVYSKQDYGPGASIMGITQNQTLADVLRTVGAPDEVHEIAGTTVLVYTQYEGMQVMGIYSNVKKSDLVIVIEGGKVAQAPIMVAKGEAMTILGVIPTPVMGPSISKED